MHALHVAVLLESAVVIRWSYGALAETGRRRSCVSAESSSARRAEECLELLLALNASLLGTFTLHVTNSVREALVEVCTLPLLADRDISCLSAFSIACRALGSR